MSIEINKENVTPYLSILLAFDTEDKTEKEIHSAIKNIIQSESDESIEVYETLTEYSGETAIVSFTPYIMKRKPSWLSNHEAKDIEHHIFISFKTENYYAFYFSEKGKKDHIRALFGKKKLETLRPIPISLLNANFINEDEIKMLWLTGVHSKSNFKADSKVLSGDSVADTLDPLIDQSYMMSAVRTEVWQNSKSTIGINPFKSSIWKGPCGKWENFENNTTRILDTLRNSTKGVTNPISILSFPISECNDLKTPYDFSLMDYEFFPDEVGIYVKELLLLLQSDYYAELSSSLTGSSKIILDVHYQGHYIGNITAEPTVNDYAVSFTIKIANVSKGHKGHIDQYAKIFKHPEIIKCWYESGHAIVNGMIFKTGYQDIEYDKFIWNDFKGYSIKKEKPGINPTKPDLAKIGKEDSLFCWVKNHWNGNWLLPNEFLATDKPTGWLLCDDGSGEKADFIHLTTYNGFNILSLIHIKAAKSNSPNRRISVGAHDVVLNQSIKNLRYCMRKNLIHDLESRLLSSGSKQCWKDGKPEQAVNFIDHLKSIHKISNFKKRVIVIQPHTLQNVYTKTVNSNIKHQLDVLLVSAENAVKSSGCDFFIIGSI